MNRTRRTVGWVLAGALTAVLVGASPAAAQSPCGASYTIRTGESLREIAQRCGVTLPALLAANPGVTDQQDVEEGDRLRIPSPAAAQPSPTRACGASYTIRTGDTLAEIAEKCGLTIPLLVAANSRLPDPLGVHAGARIRIPDLPAGAAADTTILVIAPSAAAGPEAADTAAADTAARAPDPELTRVEGVLETAGSCTRLRAANGDVYGLVGGLGPVFGPGDRVVLLGVPADGGACDADVSLEVRILYRPRGP